MTSFTFGRSRIVCSSAISFQIRSEKKKIEEASSCIHVRTGRYTSPCYRREADNPGRCPKTPGCSTGANVSTLGQCTCKSLSTYSEEILLLAQPVNITAAEGESAEVLVDHIQQIFRRGKSQRNNRRIRHQGVMRCFHLFRVRAHLFSRQMGAS